MESSRNAPSVEPVAWTEYLPKAVSGWLGQQRLWQHNAQSMPEQLIDRLFVGPTGYGKTRAASVDYVLAREQGYVNRLLWLVSTDALRQQLLGLDTRDQYDRPGLTIAEVLADLTGLRMLDAIAADPIARTLRYHLEDRAEIFVATYQQLLGNGLGFLQELTDTAGGRYRWGCVRDEVHHLPMDGRWAELSDTTSLPRFYTLSMSATPVRTDRKVLRGVPARQLDDGTWTYAATVEVSIKQALEEGAIRPPTGHIAHYFIDAETADGQQIRITTESLAAEGVTDFSSYEAKRGLRYNGAFLSSLIVEATSGLEGALLRQPGEHQMLVFAMSCAHAEFLCRDYFNDPEVGEPGSADWVGVTRSTAQNDGVLQRFKAGELKILVQVAKAGEGFDNPRCSHLLFLHLIRSEQRLFQELGRGMRRNHRISRENDLAYVYASADTPIAELVKRLEAELRSYREDEREADDRDPVERGITLPELMVLDAEWYRTDRFGPAAQPAAYPDWMQRCHEQTGTPLEQIAMVYSYIPVNGTAPAGKPRERSEREKVAYWQDAVTKATRAVAGYVCTHFAPNRVGDKELFRRVIRQIHGRWKGQRGGHDAMLSEDFRQKYDWLRGMTDELNAGALPSWLEGAVWPR